MKLLSVILTNEQSGRNIIRILQAAVCLYDPLTLLPLHIQITKVTFHDTFTQVCQWLECFFFSAD